MLYSLRDLENMDFEELKDHDKKIWDYWKAVRKVVEYREIRIEQGWDSE